MYYLKVIFCFKQSFKKLQNVPNSGINVVIKSYLF